MENLAEKEFYKPNHDEINQNIQHVFEMLKDYCMVIDCSNCSMKKVCGMDTTIHKQILDWLFDFE